MAARRRPRVRRRTRPRARPKGERPAGRAPHGRVVALQVDGRVPVLAAPTGRHRPSGLAGPRHSAFPAYYPACLAVMDRLSLNASPRRHSLGGSVAGGWRGAPELVTARPHDSRAHSARVDRDAAHAGGDGGGGRADEPARVRGCGGRSAGVPSRQWEGERSTIAAIDARPGRGAARDCGRPAARIRRWSVRLRSFFRHMAAARTRDPVRTPAASRRDPRIPP